MIGTLSRLEDDQRTMLENLAKHDPTFRRAEAMRLCRRELVELVFQAARSEMANPEKLAVIHELSEPEPATFYAPTPEAIAERRRALLQYSSASIWTTTAQRFFSLADDALADVDKALLLDLGPALPMDPRDLKPAPDRAPSAVAQESAA